MNRRSLYVPANALVLAWFVGAAAVALGHRFVPVAGWLMVHLLLLGGVSTAILLWSQHFAETLTRRPAPGGARVLWARLLGWSAGALVVTAGMVASSTRLVVAGAVVLAAVAVAHLVVLALQRRGSGRMLGNRLGHLVRYYLAATAFLPLGVALGVVLARVDVSPEVAGRLYVAHVAATLLGWVGLTVAGTIVLLWPTALRTRLSPAAETGGRHALVVLAVGILLVLAGPALGWRPLVLVGSVVVAAGLARIGWHVVEQGRAAARTHGSGSFAAWSLAASCGWFLASVLAFGVTVIAAPGWTAVPDRLTWLVAPFAVGFVAQVMLGSMSYLVPVVLGGGPGAVRWSNAAMDRAGMARWTVLNLALGVFLLPAPSWVRVAASMVGLVPLLVFLVLALRTIARQRSERTRRTFAPIAPGVATTPHWRPVRLVGGAAVGVAVVALAVVAGVAVDPAAAGLVAVPATLAQGAGATSAAGATGETTTVQVTMQDMRFTPSRIEVPAGDRLVIELVNADDQVHDLVLATGASSGRLPSGESTTVDVGVVTADVAGWCSVAGHRLMGMTLDVVTTGGTTLADEAGQAGGTSAEASGDHAEMDHGSGATGTTAPGAPSAAADVDLMAEPDAGWQPHDATLAPVATSGTDAQGMTSEPDPDGTGTLHRITLTVAEREVEVAPGVTQTLWTYNGQAPGPVLHGAVGDTFEVTLVNDASIGHSIDFHAGALAPDEPMRTIDPGESLVYTFRAERSGVWMYHCSTMPMSMHIANGMAGAVVIDPPGLEPVDREYLLVQSEYYLGPQGGEADPARIATQNPDLVVFNGYANAYRYAPLTARVGERVRIWVLDVGPNRPSSFHVVGGQFDTVFAEGDYLLRDGGSTGTGGSQALALQPAQGGFVELAFPEVGRYSLVSHLMSDAEKGAAGYVAVTP